MKFEQWKGFKEGEYQDKIDVRGFINLNYTPYEGDKSFLAGPTERTKKVMEKVNKLLKKEMDKGGVLDVDTERYPDFWSTTRDILTRSWTLSSDFRLTSL